jgi:preprotein translocase subunit YajC
MILAKEGFVVNQKSRHLFVLVILTVIIAGLMAFLTMMVQITAMQRHDTVQSALTILNLL